MNYLFFSLIVILIAIVVYSLVFVKSKFHSIKNELIVMNNKIRENIKSSNAFNYDIIDKSKHDVKNDITYIIKKLNYIDNNVVKLCKNENISVTSNELNTTNPNN